MKRSLQSPNVASKLAEFDYYCELDEASKHVRTYGIRAYPTILILDLDGNEKRRHVGYMSPSALLAWLD